MQRFLNAPRRDKNVLKFYQISSSGMAIIMGQISAKIRIMHFSLYYTHIWHFDFTQFREKTKSNSGGFFTRNNRHTTGRKLMKF